MLLDGDKKPLERKTVQSVGKARLEWGGESSPLPPNEGTGDPHKGHSVLLWGVVRNVDLLQKKPRKNGLYCQISPLPSG